VSHEYPFGQDAIGARTDFVCGYSGIGTAMNTVRRNAISKHKLRR
jgi:hypothetical protein